MEDYEFFSESIGKSYLDYPKVIKNPIDLSVIQDRLCRDQYPSLAAATVDFHTMVQNAITWYNYYRKMTKISQDQHIMAAAKRLQIVFDTAVAQSNDPARTDEPISPTKSRRSTRRSAISNTSID